jgi:hypothetical protein
MRVLMLFWSLWAMPLLAHQYNTMLLEAEAEVFPKLLLLSDTPKDLLRNNALVFAIVYEPEDKQTALRLKRKMEAAFDRTTGFHLQALPVLYSKIDSVRGISAFFALYSSDQMHQVVRKAQELHVPSFVFDTAYLDSDFLFALNIERYPVIYLNAEALPKYSIVFSDALYQIVKFYDEKSFASFAF